MDFSWTAEQTQLFDQAREFAANELASGLEQRDRDGSGTGWEQDWRRCAEFGVLGVHVPCEFGGRGYDLETAVGVLEAIGHGCRDNGLTLGLNAQIWAQQQPLLEFGSDEQKKRFLPGLCDGSLIGADAMTEPQSGSDAFSLQTRAKPVDGGYVLNGSKAFIGFAPACDVALVFAATNPERGRWGLSAFLVEGDSDGLGRGPVQPKMGLRSIPTGQLEFNDCWVPAANRLGPEGAGAAVFNYSAEWERCFILSSHVGAMARQLEESAAFARQRSQFGKPINEFQAVSGRLADMRLRLETSRLLLYQCAWKKASGDNAVMEAAMAKLHISEAFVASSMDAVRIHGGRGYLTEFGIERDLRDAMGGVIYGGTSDIQRELIARMLE